MDQYPEGSFQIATNSSSVISPSATMFASPPMS
jgi:hypothetical protein